MAIAKQVIEPHPLGFHMWRHFQWAREAWWIVTGRWSLHRAWQSGYDRGTQSEYRRIITNKGEIDAQRRNVTSLLRPASVAVSLDMTTPEGRQKAADNARHYRERFKPFA